MESHYQKPIHSQTYSNNPLHRLERPGWLETASWTLEMCEPQVSYAHMGLNSSNLSSSQSNVTMVIALSSMVKARLTSISWSRHLWLSPLPSDQWSPYLRFIQSLLWGPQEPSLWNFRLPKSLRASSTSNFTLVDALSSMTNSRLIHIGISWGRHVTINAAASWLCIVWLCFTSDSLLRFTCSSSRDIVAQISGTFIVSVLFPSGETITLWL